MTDKNSRTLDAIASTAKDIADHKDTPFVKMLCADPRVGLSERERAAAAKGQVSADTAHKIAAAAERARKR